MRRWRKVVSAHARSLGRTWRLLVSLALVPVATSWLADYAREALRGESANWGGGDWLLVVLAVILLLTAVFLFLNAVQSVLVRITRLARADAVRPHRVWVGALSPSRWRWTGEGLKLDGEGPTVPLPADNLDAAVDAMAKLKPTTPWEQTLRGLRPHLGELERIVLLTSVGQNGSDAQFDQCRALLEHVCGRPIKCVRKPCPFDSLDALLTTLREAVAEAADPREVILDITGGYKLTSIAAAMVSLEHPEVEMQYVHTEGDKQVLAFNVVTVHPTAVP